MDLARPATWFGVVTIAALAASTATSGTALQGWSQRAATVIVVSGIVVPAWRVIQLETDAVRGATLAAAW